jgi:hypothetical protein
MAAPAGVLPPRIPLREVYELCLEGCLGNSTLAKRRLVQLGIKVPSWAMDPFGPITQWVWPTLLEPHAGEIDTANNAILLYGPGYWLGIEFDRAAALAFLGIEESLPSPDSSRDTVDAALAATAKPRRKIGRPSSRQPVRTEAKRQIREELDNIPDLLKTWGTDLAAWLATQPGKHTVTGPIVEGYVRLLHRFAKRQKLLKPGK